MRDEGKGSIVIAGYGPGVGDAVMRKFAELGYRPVLIARDRAKLDMTLARLRSEGIEASVEPVDVNDVARFTQVLEAIKARERVEVLLYNAAIARPGPLLSIDGSTLEADFRLCVTGALSSARAFAPEMIARKRGTLLFTGGGLALHPSPSAPTLSIGKSGIRALALMLAAELSPKGVRVGTVTIAGTVAPGTPFSPQRIAEAFAQLHATPPDERTAELVFRGD